MSLPSPLPSVSSYFPVIFASVVRSAILARVQEKIMENYVYRNFKGFFFVFKWLKPVILLDLGHKLNFFTFFSCWNQEVERGRVC